MLVTKDKLDIVEHFKGGRYLVLTENAKHSTTGERLVVYQELSGNNKYTGGIRVRPYSTFYEEIRSEDITLEIVPRFKKVGEL